MAGVPQKTLSWLWDVLRREYRDPQRTYSDLAQTLALYPGFGPRTDVYTFEHGAPALLIHLNGTLPVSFRGSTYRFPIAIWVPHAYPYEGPMIYVDPTDDMIIRPGQHVSAADGRIYHPYLARWRETWDSSNIVEFLKLLAGAFAREPPVMSKQQTTVQQIPQHQPQPKPPPRPPLPGEERRFSAQSSSPTGAPPPPPKQPALTDSSDLTSNASRETRKPGRYDAPPPLPHEANRQIPPNSAPLQQMDGYRGQPPPQRQGSLRHDFPQQQMSVQDPRYQSPPPRMIPQRTQPIPQPQPQPQYLPAMANQQYHPSQPNQQPGQHPPFQMEAHLQQQQRPRPHDAPPIPHPMQQPTPKPRQDLLDDSPFDISLPKADVKLPTPAIPPNPEKAALLSTLSGAILQVLHNQIQQSHSALPALQSQNSALASAHQQLNGEISHLKGLQTQISQNITALNQTMSSADRTIASAKQDSSTGNKVPGIDEMIIPPTVVARQIYDAVSEQRGYEAAIWALTEGFVRGRIGSEIWGRKTRECAREEFKRKWLVKRIGRGMGLDTNEM